MKKIFPILLTVLLLSGCGSPSSSSSTSSTPTVRRQENKRVDRFINEGVNYLKEGKVAKAIGSFGEAIKLDPRDPRAFLVLAETYVRLESVDRALDTLNSSLTFNSENADINYMLAVCFNLKGNREMTERFAQRSVLLYRKAENRKGFANAVSLLSSLQSSEAEEGETLDRSVTAMETEK
jgi:Tfp pilus assembly protein PilF